MAGQLYATQTPRIGKTKGEILARAIPCEVLGLAASNKELPKNNSTTIIFRRWVPYNATVGNPNIMQPDVSPAGTVETEASNRVTTMVNAHLTSEGVTPAPDSVVAQDITAVMVQYSCLYSFTDIVSDLYEDEIEDVLKTQVAERMMLVKELELYSKVRAGTNRFFGGAGTTAAVALRMLRRAVTIELNPEYAKMIRARVSPILNQGDLFAKEAGK